MPVTSNYDPYAPNSQGLTEALIDLKSTMQTQTFYSVAGFQAVAFEDVVQGEALYSRIGDGLVGKAIANSTEDRATVVGFAQTSKLAGELVRVLIVGVLASSGLSPGRIYYLSNTTAGQITITPPSTPNHYVTRVGEAASSAELIVQLEPPIEIN